MPIQDLEKLFNMKVNKYEMQGQPLEQAAASAAGEMKQDPRVMQLVKTYQGQMAQPQNVNVRQEGQPKQTAQSGGGNAGMGIVNLMTTAIKQGLFGNLEQGESTANQNGYTEEGQQTMQPTTTSPEPVEGSPEWMQKHGVKKYSMAESLSPILAARTQYKNLKMAEESAPYELPLKGYATPPTYFGIGLNKKITDMLKKQPIEKEEEEAINQFKTSMKYSLELFKPEELDYRWVNDKKYAKKPSSGKGNPDIYAKAQDDISVYIKVGKDMIGNSEDIENLSGAVDRAVFWARQALTGESTSGSIADGTAEVLLDQAAYYMSKPNRWADANKNRWGKNKQYLEPLLKETYRKLLDVQHGDDMLDADKIKATDEWYKKRMEMTTGVDPVEESIADAVAKYNAADENGKAKILNFIKSMENTSVAKEVLLRIGYSNDKANAFLGIGVK